jgi:hypothetical protein
MRASKSSAYFGVKGARQFDGWLQAGLKSSAYRLAHLVLPRSVYVTVIAVIFYIA